MVRYLMMCVLMVACAAQEPLAFVLGKPIHFQQAGGAPTEDQWKSVAWQIQRELMEQYALAHGLKPTPEEMASLRSRIESTTGGQQPTISQRAEGLRRDLIRSGLDERTASQQVKDWVARASTEEQNFFAGIIQWWKVGRALYQQYGGGRVRLSAFGAHEPIDSMERFLIEEESRGRFSIPNAHGREVVWGVFRNKSGGDGMVSGTKADEIYSRRPWEQPR